MILLALTLAAAAPLPLTPDERADVRCLAVAALSQPAPGSKADTDGREFSVMIGGDLIDRTGRTRDQVGQIILDEARRAYATRPNTSELRGCTMRIEQRLRDDVAADAPLPPPVRSN